MSRATYVSNAGRALVNGLCDADASDVTKSLGRMLPREASSQHAEYALKMLLAIASCVAGSLGSLPRPRNETASHNA